MTNERKPIVPARDETFRHSLFAIRHFAESDQEILQINTLASEKAHKGIDLLERGGSENLIEAIRYFDEVIALRRNMPFHERPYLRYGYTAGWLNRGDAFTRLGSPVHLVEGLRSFDIALEELRYLPPGEHPLFRRRHAIAWTNRGRTLLEISTPQSLVEAVRSFDRALKLVEPGDAEHQAIIWMNRANALLRTGPSHGEEAADSARQSIALAENRCTAFQARFVLCQALSIHAADRKPIEEIGDIIDEAMELARGEGVTFPLVVDFFRFGCRFYEACQPQFLAEFVLENVDPESPDMIRAAEEAIHRGIHSIRSNFRFVGTPEHELVLDRLQDLRLAAEKLAMLTTRLSPSRQ
ncbi:MAG TPA: hypothetical protein VIT91_06340 [Chthoniobacterales bacterium]